MARIVVGFRRYNTTAMTATTDCATGVDPETLAEMRAQAPASLLRDAANFPFPDICTAPEVQRDSQRLSGEPRPVGMAPLFLTRSEVLHALGPSDNAMAAAITVETGDSVRVTRNVASLPDPRPLGFGGGNRLIELTADWVEARLPGKPALWLTRPDEAYWWIIESRVNRPGGLFAIIGARTFSAAQLLVHDLERWTDAIFIGEPSGSSPQFWGDHSLFRLPHGGLLASASPTWWQPGGPYDRRDYLAPDVAAEPLSEDHRRNRDPALGAILS